MTYKDELRKRVDDYNQEAERLRKQWREEAHRKGAELAERIIPRIDGLLRQEADLGRSHTTVYKVLDGGSIDDYEAAEACARRLLDYINNDLGLRAEWNRYRPTGSDDLPPHKYLWVTWE